MDEMELINIQADQLKCLAIKTQTQREEIDGRKPGIKSVLAMYFPLKFSN